MTFEEYVLTRGPALVRLARLLVGDDHRAEDLVQDVLAKAYPRWARICRTDQPDLYLRRMLVNARNSWWRRRANRELAVAEPTDGARPDASDPAADRDAMWRLVAALPDRQRAVLVLRFYEDLDDAAIAGILGCSAVTVRTHAMRALATLRGRVGDAGWPVREESKR
ncbi:SigE family RNA polymerase sigma factor [Micromonospora sp. CPCC 206061]|uniref:SigE family RNA polymerase sigma factor n=1 Tax=Micromonospora sp. CPCC 206061 TaxID=3122410 RepID=UPI002FF245B8